MHTALIIFYNYAHCISYIFSHIDPIIIPELMRIEWVNVFNCNDNNVTMQYKIILM